MVTYSTQPIGEDGVDFGVGLKDSEDEYKDADGGKEGEELKNEEDDVVVIVGDGGGCALVLVVV